jgi:hypothetical protein
VIGAHPDSARIWQNVTSGVRLISAGDGLQSWSAIFETEIRWEYA